MNSIKQILVFAKIHRGIFVSLIRLLPIWIVYIIVKLNAWICISTFKMRNISISRNDLPMAVQDWSCLHIVELAMLYWARCCWLTPCWLTPWKVVLVGAVLVGAVLFGAEPVGAELFGGWFPPCTVLQSTPCTVLLIGTVYGVAVRCFWLALCWLAPSTVLLVGAVLVGAVLVGAVLVGAVYGDAGWRHVRCCWLYGCSCQC